VKQQLADRPPAGCLKTNLQGAKKMKALTGMIAAVPTPFASDDTIDYTVYQQLLDFIIENKMHWLLIGGSTGEYSLMSMDERKQLLENAIKINHGRTNILAGCSCDRTSDTVEMVRFAEAAGADMVLALPPYYLQTSRQGIIDYYQELSDNLNQIGIAVYHYPHATNVTLDPELIFELAQIKNVVALKNTDEMDHTAKVLELTKNMPDFSVVNGYETLIMGTLALGGAGTMGIVHNLVPREMVAIYDAFLANDVVRAREINNRLTPLYIMMEEEPYPGPIKAALELIGIPMGIPRRPIVPASADLRKRLEAAMKEAGVL
jgi:4-hydroxy-tetrahydrodipicolinate synthase